MFDETQWDGDGDGEDGDGMSEEERRYVHLADKALRSIRHYMVTRHPDIDYTIALCHHRNVNKEGVPRDVHSHTRIHKPLMRFFEALMDGVRYSVLNPNKRSDLS